MKNSEKADSILSAQVNELEKKLERAQAQLLAEQEEKGKVHLELQKHKKELFCHTQLSLIFSEADFRYNDALTQVLECIILSCQYPDLAGAMIKLGRKEYKTPKFSRTGVYSKEEPIVVSNKKIGSVIICYPKSKFGNSQNWLPEEIKLLHSVSERVGNLWEKYNQKKKASSDELLYTSMLDSLPDSILVTDLYGKVVYFSPRSPQFFGYEKETDLTGHSIFEFLDDKEHTRAAKLIEDMFLDANSGAIEYVGSKADGSKFEIEINGELIRENDGNVINMIFVTRDISERKRIEQDLLESQRMLSVMMQNMPGIAYRCLNDANWTMKFISEGCFGLTGFSSEEFTGEKQKSYARIIHPDDREKVRNAVADALKEERPFEAEYRIITANGDTKYVWEKGQGVREKGRLTYIEGLIIDITKRASAEENLRNSEEKYRSIFENIQDTYYEATIDGIITEISPSIKILSYGQYRREDLIGKSVLDIYADPEEREAFLKKMSETGKVIDFEINLRNKDRKLIPVAVTASFQKDEKGIPFKVVGNIRNISERKKAAEELKQSEERYKSVFSKSQSVMLLVDPETAKIVDANQAACNFYGWSYEDLVQKSVSDINTLEKEELMLNLQLARNEEKTYFLFKHRLANGEVRDVEVFINPVNVGGEILDYEIIHDVTDRIKAENALLESEQKLKRAQQIAKMGSWEFNFNTGEMKWSENMYQITGYNKDEVDLSFEFFIQRVHPGDRAFFEVTTTFKKGESWSNEFRFFKKSGEIVWLKNNFVPVFEGDQLIALYGTNIDITERKKAQQALEKSAQDLKTAQSIAQIGSWDFDLKTYETTWSDNFYKLVGLSREEVKDPFGQFLSMIDTDDRTMVEKTIREAGHTDKAIENEMRFNLPNGKTIWIQNRIQAEFEDGKVVRLHGVFIDITEKRKSEKTILEQNKRFSAVLDSIPDLIFVVDRDGKFHEYYCPEERELIVPREEILSSDITKVFSGEELRFHKQKLDECFVSETLISYEYSYVAEDQKAYYEARLKKIGDNRAIIMIQDITEKHIRNQEVRKLSQAVQQSPAMTVITDLDGNIEYVNAAFENITGYSFNEALGKNPRFLQSGKTKPSVYKQMWKALKTGKQWRGEWQNKKKNGDYYWEDIIVMPFLDEKEELTKYMAVKLDITDRKLAEQEILELNNDLEKKVEKRTLELSALNEKLLAQLESQKRVEKELRWNQTLLESMSNSSPLGILVVDTKSSNILYANHRHCKIWGFEQFEDEISKGRLNYKVLLPYTKAKLSNPDEYLQRNISLLDETNDAILTDEIAFVGNRTIKRYTSPLRGKTGEYFGRLFIYEDITLQKRDANFQRELLHLSTQLTGIPYKQIEPSIKSALKKIGQFLLADRAYIFEFESADKKYLNNTYEWVADDVTAQIENLQHVPSNVFPKWIEELKADRNIIIPNTSELGEGWEAEKVIFEAQGTKSVMVIPLKNENVLIGFAGLDFVKEYKDYRDAEVKTLQLWSTILSALINNLKMEKLLEQSRQNYLTFFNTIDDFLLVVDNDGDILHMNNTVINRLGYSTEELIGQSALMIRPDDVKEEAVRNFREIIEGKLNESFLPIETKSGTRIMVETKFKKGTWNETPCWFIVSKDISAIKLSEEKFSKAFHTAVSLLAISEVETQKLVEVNETWLKVLGYTREEVIGKTPTELELLVFPEDGEELRNKYLNNESIRDIEISFRCKNGEIRTGLFSAEDLKLGQSRSVLSVIVDITERKKMELELLEARNEAEKANDAKSEFLSRMSHELRTPMNSILGFVQLLERGDLNPKQQKATKHIHSSGKHLLNLINEVLDISRIEAGRMQLSLEAVSLPTVVRQVVEIIIPQAKEKNVWIDFIENPGDPEFVLADIQRMKQVLLNLLGNAVKYNRTGGNITIQYGKHNCEDDGTVILKITDTGSGIRQEDIEKLFTPFERIGAENTPVDGTGLGLAVSKKLVEAMNGKIGVESELGTGSTFWVELHCVPAKKETGFKYPKKHSVLSANGSKKGTVVYVEDNSSNIELVEQILGDYFPGVLLKTISDGSKAFGFILENKADLVFLDLNLPGLKGEEILHQLKMDKAARKIPVIVLSANAMPEKIDKLMSMGADNYIPKPIDVAVFLEVIDKFLSQ